MKNELSVLPLFIPLYFTPILGLLAVGRPSAVFRFVIPVVVDSIQRVSGSVLGHLAHIGKEILERITPAFAHDNSSTAVIVEPRKIFIVASFFCRYPRGVFLGFAAPMVEAVSIIFESFIPKAPTAFGVARPKLIDACNYFFPATALSNAPSPMLLHEFGFDRQSTVGFSNYADMFSHALWCNHGLTRQ